MIEHLVLFKMKPEAEAGLVDQIIAALRALKTKVPSVVDLTAGRNFSARAQGYHFGLTVRFKDLAGLEAYAIHPEHQAVVTGLVKPNVAEVLALDYEI